MEASLRSQNFSCSSLDTIVRRCGPLLALALAVLTLTQTISAQTVTILGNTQDINGLGSWGILAQGIDGALYGTTFGGGKLGWGEMYRITPEGDLADVADFNGANGLDSQYGLTLGSDGAFYGASQHGGTRGCNGTGCGVFYTIHWLQ
jgi:uncharacterized repeat protein (TIGR03803 family)